MYDWVMTTTLDPSEYNYVNYIYYDGYFINEDEYLIKNN